MYSQVTLATVFAGVAAAMDWNIIAERQPGGPGTEILTDRINYGDGTLYLASEKPADVDLWLDDVMRTSRLSFSTLKKMISTLLLTLV